MRYFGVVSTIRTMKLFFSPVADVASVAGVGLSAVAIAEADDAGISSAMDAT
jgi:hypothetical protein